jgi:tetrapyrrole methylase family protein/MazG family protein
MQYRVKVIGTGYGRPDTALLRNQLAGSTSIVARTFRHPGLEEAVREAAPPEAPVLSCDDLYDAAESFDELYPRIAARVMDLASQGPVAYLVPGSPLVAEQSVRILQKDLQAQSISIIEAPSIIDGALSRLQWDFSVPITIADASELGSRLYRISGNVLALQAFDPAICRDLAIEALELGANVILMKHIGLEDEKVQPITEASLDLMADADHLTTIAISGLTAPLASFDDLVGTVKTLRTRCPWDARQTHESLAPHIIEEAYELVDAIEELDGSVKAEQHLAEELGDVLLGVLMNAVIASETGSFGLEQVIETLSAKLIRRHPHVFGDVQVSGANEVVANWEAIKKAENQFGSVTDGIAKSLPATTRLKKLIRKARSVNLDLDPFVAKIAATDEFSALAVKLILAGQDIDARLRDIARQLEQDVKLQESQHGDALSDSFTTERSND